ncbi:MAG: pknH 2, partial [Planctomycetaceae bacterium]|nr:pknH 2 [Planctomycetaceae bacterium]
EIDGTHFLVMEYVPGLDLAEVVKRLGTLSVADACEVIRQAAVGLQYAHSHGMVHRDIKPSNLMLQISEEQGQRHGVEVPSQAGLQRSSVQQPVAIVKILDMGLALLAEQHAPNAKELTSTGQLMGTIDYMAPEQGIDTHSVDIRADIFSLGASLFKLLTGDVPLTSDKYDTLMKKLMALATTTLPSIGTRRADLPPALVTIVDRMLAKEPAARYATPADVAQALAPFARNHRLTAVLGAAMGDVSLTDIDRITLSDSPSVSNSSETAETFIAAAPAITAGGGKRGLGAAIGATPSPARPPQRKFPGGLSRGRLLAMAGGAAVALLGVVIFFFNGGDGVRIEMPDDGAFTVQFDKNGILISGPHPAPIRVTSTQVANGDTTTIGPGRHKLVIRRGDLEFETKEFVLKEKGRTTLKIEAFAGNGVQLTKDGVVYDQGSLDTPKVAAAAAAPRAVAITPSKPPKIAHVDPPSPQPPATELWKPGPLLNRFTGLVHRPASLPGIKRWQIDTAVPTASTHSVSWSPDGRQFICVTGKRPRIYDRQTLRLVGTLPAASQEANIVAWNPVEDWIAAASDRIIRLWKADGTPGPVLESHPEPVSSLVWNATGTRLASSSAEGAIRVWGTDGAKLHEFRAAESNQPILAWGPDGQLAYQVRFADKVHIVGEDGTPKRTHVMAPGIQCSNLVWHRDGRLAAQSYSNGMLYTWNADGTDGPKIESVAWQVAWLDDGDRMLLSNTSLRVWDRVTGKVDMLADQIDPAATSSLSQSPDGKSLVVCTNSGAIEIRSLEGKRLLGIVPLPQTPYIAWNPAGTLLAGVESNGTLRMWKPTGEPLDSIPVSPGRALSVTWSPDGEYFAWGMEHGSQSVHILSLSQADRTPTLTINGGGSPLAFSPDCKFIFLGGAKEIRRLDGTFVAKIPSDLSAQTAAWSSKGQLAAGSAHDLKCQFFEQNGSLSLAIEPPEKGCCPIQGLVWNRSGTHLAAANFSYRKTVIVDSKGKIGPILQTHHEYLAHVDWSPDEQQVVTGGSWPTVQITGRDGTRGPVYEKGGCKSVSWGEGPNRGRIAISLGTVAEVWNADLSEMLWVVITFPGGKSATFNGAGQLTHGDEALIEDHLLYFVERTDGRVDVVRPAAFRAQLLKADRN